MDPSNTGLPSKPRRRVAQKFLGQHFLVDPKVVSTLVEAAKVASRAQVLEIGPGHGAITFALAGQVMPGKGLILAVEKDHYLVAKLRERFKSKAQVKIVAGDILALRESDLLEPQYQVVGNIPFSATSPIITKFLLAQKRPERISLIVQKEVAERLTARAGSANRGVLTALIELFGQAKLISKVSREAFRPQPEVDAAIIDLELSEPAADPRAYLSLLKAGFASKRRQFHNSLGASLHLSSNETKQLLEKAKIESTLRAEDLTLRMWLNLLVALRENS